MGNKPSSIELSSAFKRLEEQVGLAARPWVAVVGAGLSAADIHTWPQLYEILKSNLEEQADSSPEEFDRLYPFLERLEEENQTYWQKFEILKDAIPASYKNIIRAEFSKKPSSETQKIYETLWSLSLKGVLSLNLDDYARRTGRESDLSGEIRIFQGYQAGKLRRILNDRPKFLYELHGSVEDENSWVFTETELKKLYHNKGYQDFLKTIYTQFHVVFIGISAEDDAISKPLSELSDSETDLPAHFWITDRTDDTAVNWARQTKVERVLYPRGHHEQVLIALKSLRNASAAEPEGAPVVSPTFGNLKVIPESNELLRRDTETIRRILNGHANYLLAQNDMKRFETFLIEYDEVIDRSWYIPPAAEGYNIFEYTLESPAAKGAFGAVYKAIDSTGNEIALKLLKRDIRSDTSLIHAFRRGVEAMRILDMYKVPGMVSYKNASEIPAFVTMDWIEGPNLKEAKDARLVQDWRDILDVFLQATKIISAAHKLPEVVLHRDIRPANIMLREGWSKHDGFDVVVLDFDLATYTGAQTESVIADGSFLGYLAPEQLNVRRSSRSALVDSFGLGMTLYFLVGGVEPDAYLHRAADYPDQVRNATRMPQEAPFLCTARRIERIILGCTQEKQSDRLRVDHILWECKRIWNANNFAETASALDGDLAAEEIAANCASLSGKYSWNAEKNGAEYSVSSGPDVCIRGFSDTFDVILELKWADEGNLNRSNLSKYLPGRLKKATAALELAGWDVSRARPNQHQFSIQANFRVEEDTDFRAHGKVINDVIEDLSFS